MPDEPSSPDPRRSATGDAGAQLPTIRVQDIDTAPAVVPSPGPASQEQYDKLFARFSEVSNENFDLRAKLDSEKRRVRTAETLDGLIQPYASKAYRFMVGYSATAAAFLVADGSRFHGFALPDKVLELLVGSTAVTVIGLVGMVLTGVFVGARRAG